MLLMRYRCAVLSRPPMYRVIVTLRFVTGLIDLFRFSRGLSFASLGDDMCLRRRKVPHFFHVRALPLKIEDIRYQERVSSESILLRPRSLFSSFSNPFVGPHTWRTRLFTADSPGMDLMGSKTGRASYVEGAFARFPRTSSHFSRALLKCILNF